MNLTRWACRFALGATLTLVTGERPVYAQATAPTTANSNAADPHAAHRHPKAKNDPAHDQSTPPQASADPQTHEHGAADTPSGRPPFIAPITEQDRKAAFPDVGGHAVHDTAMNYQVLFDQLEWQSGGHASDVNVDTRGWVGRDRDRFWFRAEGNSDDGRVGEAQAHALYGRQFARWWDVVAGVRQDFSPGPQRTWAALGVQGLSPYWFDIEATAYVGASGRTHARLEVQYELLITNRLVLQPLVELEIVGKSDPERGVGSGVSESEAGFRLRYEFRRELAPYIGLVWNNKWGKTADFARAAGENIRGARFVSGLRLWF
jgi:copper resistance protein B